jgi:ADP-ribose pyrophosphatase YjhB (NUDIX family)
MTGKKYRNQDRILVAVDCVIFGFDGRQINALLIKREVGAGNGKWALPGGFVGKDENPDDAAARVLKQVTGLRNIYTEQLYCFGMVDLDLAHRIVSISYTAFVNISKCNAPFSLDEQARWFPVCKIPLLVLDHKRILKMARGAIMEKVTKHLIAFQLLPTKFTLRHLQNLYEAICESSFDDRNFTKKILTSNVLKKLNEKEKSSRKGAYYYVFDRGQLQKTTKQILGNHIVIGIRPCTSIP